jgi:hypothetical protein
MMNTSDSYRYLGIKDPIFMMKSKIWNEITMSSFRRPCPAG